MAEPIGVGDFLECVAGKPERGLHSGAVYRCEGVVRPTRAVCEFDGCDGSVGAIHVVGVGARRGYHGFCANRFRPVYRPRASLIESLKVPPKRASRKLVKA